MEGNDPANSFHSHVGFWLPPVLLSAHGLNGVYSTLHSLCRPTGEAWPLLLTQRVPRS
jgi:hypothetical protein